MWIHKYDSRAGLLKLLSYAAPLRKFICIKAVQKKSLYGFLFRKLDKLQNNIYSVLVVGAMPILAELFCYSCSRPQNHISFGYMQRVPVKLNGTPNHSQYETRTK